MRSTWLSPSLGRADAPTVSHTSGSVPASNRPRRFTIRASAPVSAFSSRSACPMSDAQMAMAMVAPCSSWRGMPTDRVTLRCASMATPLLPRPLAIIAVRASSLAAAAGSNAGTEEYRTACDSDTMSSLVTSLVLCNVASVRRAASEMRPRSPLAMASCRRWSPATTGVSSRMRCRPVSTIFAHSAWLPLISVCASWSRSNCSR